MIQIKVTARTKEVLIAVPKQRLLHQNGIRKALYDIGGDIVRETSRLIKTGARTGRWYTYRGRDIRASAAGEVPANRSGKLAKSGDYKVSGPYEMRVGETAKYAGYLEDGTKRMRPRPHLIRAIENRAGDSLNTLAQYGLNEIGYK